MLYVLSQTSFKIDIFFFTLFSYFCDCDFNIQLNSKMFDFNVQNIVVDGYTPMYI